MALTDQQDGYDPNDPYANVRRRVMGQLDGEATVTDPTQRASQQDITPAPFDTGAGATTTADTGTATQNVTVPPPAGGGVVTPQGDRETTPPQDPTGPPGGTTVPPGGTFPGPTTPPSGGAPPVTPGFRDAVNALYQKYYGRPATDAELQGHAGNPGGINAIEDMLKASLPPGGTTGTTGTGAQPSTATDQNALIAYLRGWAAAHPNANPSVGRDPGYWASRMLQTHGNNPIDWGYWEGRMNTPEGPPEGAQTGGNAGRTTLTPPTLLSPTGLTGQYGLQAPQGLWSPDFIAQLRSMIMERLNQAGQPVDPNDPNISTAVNAARDTASRQTEAERSQLAERAYAQGGLNTDLLGRQIQQSNERTGTALGSLRAKLITNEIQQRRQELQSLLQMSLSAGDAQSAREIQLQLAALNAQLTEQAQGIQLGEFGANLNLQSALAGLRG